MGPRDPGREAFLRDAGRIYDEVVLGAGPASGQSFDDMEERAEAAGLLLRRKLLAQRLGAEEAMQPAIIPCPQCGRPMRWHKDPAPRNLDTFSGPVAYERRHAVCDPCGISFSPAGPPARHPRPRGVGPPRHEGL
ncbi:MAG: hypothetical protein FJ291_31485 [Planctomycetes bacterium]|nr:hypothetical protein [Planctomycetota bacterium]